MKLNMVDVHDAVGRPEVFRSSSRTHLYPNFLARRLCMLMVLQLLFLAILLIFFQEISSSCQFSGQESAPNECVVRNVSAIKSSKWIVVTSVQNPTEGVKKLASLDDWNLVVVADMKTPPNWNHPGVHFLSLQVQKALPFRLTRTLPFASYTRKNIGYLYAIALGAEWIYDTDDDNKPFGKGLEQFDYQDTVSGVRFMKDRSSADFSHRLFNPYRFFGNTKLWPRGFPPQLIYEHNNGERLTLCMTMKRAAVQQGLVQRDPDVDRLLEVDRVDGLAERFKKFAPPVTLAPGTFSPWNSQNTLFHKSAFHTLFLPTTVSFRTTDIWRSYFAQPLLHLAGDTVSFVPVNAIQKRNSHNYLKDFDQEKQVFEQSGELVSFLDSWKCASNSIRECYFKLAHDFTIKKFWAFEDEWLAKSWVRDLQYIGFEFPKRTSTEDLLVPPPMDNDTRRDVNCRRIDLQMQLDVPLKSTQPAGRRVLENLMQGLQAVERAMQKLDGLRDLDVWCQIASETGFSKSMPSPKQLAARHAKSDVLVGHLDKVLIVVSNWPWKQGIGILQRIYQPFFGLVIFCGTWDPNNYNSTGQPPIQNLFNYVNMNVNEMERGFFGYHCMTLVQEMNLSNVRGYFLISDDMMFNFWHPINDDHMFHPLQDGYVNRGEWWESQWGLPASKRIVATVKNSTDPAVLDAWAEFERGLRAQGFVVNGTSVGSAFDEMLDNRSWLASDFYYVPSSLMGYFSRVMRIFYDGMLFQEIAVNKFLRSVAYQTYSFEKGGSSVYFWNKNRTTEWGVYNADIMTMHPVKLSQYSDLDTRKMFCSTILKTFAGVLFDNSIRFTARDDFVSWNKARFRPLE